MHPIRFGIISFGLFFLTFSAWSQEPEITNFHKIHDQMIHYRMESPALGKTISFSAVTPTSYSEEGQVYPVVYLLHGAGRSNFTLTDFETTREVLLNASFVTVMPYGENGWWIDSPVSQNSNYETYIGEIIQVSQEVLNISSDKGKRGITGWSMGGFGAIRYAELHPELFTAAAAILGLLDFPNPELPSEQNHSVPSIFGATGQTQNGFNPLPHAQALKNMEIFLITADQAFDFTMNEHFHTKLSELDIAHEYIILNGTHTFDIVEESLPLVVDFFEQVFNEQSVCTDAKLYR